MNPTIPEVDADSVKRMIDSSRQSKASTVECKDVDEKIVEKKKSKASNDNDFAFLLNIFDFLTWP